MKRTLLIVLVLLCCGGAVSAALLMQLYRVRVVYADDRATLQDGYFKTEALGQGSILYTNHVDGYSLVLPDTTAIDMGQPGLYSGFSMDGLSMRVIRQPMYGLRSIYNYIDYSNSLLRESPTHRVEADYFRLVNGKPAKVTQWSREVFSGVAGDRGQYAVVDLVTSVREVFSFEFRSDTAFRRAEEYLGYVKSFRLGQAAVELNPIPYPSAAPRKWAEVTREAFDRHFSADVTLSWGIFEPSYSWGPENLLNLEEALSYRFPFLVFYEDFDMGDPAYKDTLARAKAEDRILELTLQAVGRADGSLVAYDVLQGRYDAFLEDFATAVAENRHPILMRLGNEMNGDWCAYSALHTGRDPDVFLALYRYVYDYFERKGANDYAIWVWNPNGRSFPDFKWNAAARYFPGAEYVDVVGLTMYNTGTYYGAERWQSFGELYGPLYDQYSALFDMPLMITEFASSSVGGDKEAWVRDMFQQIRDYRRIKVAIWWNHADYDAQGNVSRPYWLDETPGLLALFAAGLAGSSFDTY